LDNPSFTLPLRRGGKINWEGKGQSKQLRYFLSNSSSPSAYYRLQPVKQPLPLKKKGENEG